MRTVNEIINSLKEYLISLNSTLGNFKQYSNIYVLLRAIALIVAEQDFLVESAKESFYLRTAKGIDLDKRATDIGLTRFEGNYAEGTIFISSSSTTSLPKGLVLSTATRATQWELTESTVSSITEKIVQVKCLTTGFVNLEAGSILTSILYPSVRFVVGSFKDIKGNYTGAIISGSDREIDEAFRSRIITHLKSYNRFSKSYLLNKLTTIPNLNRVLIKENEEANGIVSIYIDSQDARVKDLVKEIIDENLVLGIVYKIKSLKYSYITIGLDVRVSATTNLGTLEDNIKTTILNFIDGVEIGKNIEAQEIGAAILNLPGVRGVVINQPSNFLTPTKGTLFKVSDFLINYIREA